MASFLSFSQRMAANATRQTEDANDDPWNLGVSTSTSTAETNACDDARLSKNPPRTPEGLRPRKSIQRIRRDILGSHHYAHETKLSYNLPPDVGANYSALPPIHRHFSSFGNDLGILPLERIDGSPIRSASSFYEQSIEESNNNNNNNNNVYDEDINSSMEESSIYSHIQAESPDLKRGARPKTAVGALLVAMAETSEPNQNRFTTAGHHNRILPPRSWMNNKREDKYLMNEPSNDMINTNTTADMNYGRDDDDDDDNQSSLHASPSSLRRGVFPSSWNDEQRFQSDASFTRRILNDDPSSSRLEERSIVDHSPYDFNPIMEDGIHGRQRINAPRVLSLKDNNKLNISAISNSHHQKDFESINTSLADTIEDEEEQYKEIPRYYQALADDAPAQNIISDDAFLMKKVENQRLDKEDLLRSTFERFQDCLDLLKDVYSQGAIENSFFLGLSKKTGNEYCVRLQALASELQDGTQRRALLFCLSILKNSFSNTATDVNYLSNTRWVPRPGFRSSLDLNEEPLSPQTIRGGDTSLFSLPSESANADTPHTSNVSLATTITTVVSPGKYASSIHNRFSSRDQNAVDMSIQGTQKTVTSLARLLYRLEETCRGLKSKIGRKSMLVESIQKIYFELLNVSSADLKVIISSFDMEYAEPQTLARAVSNDEVVASRLPRSIKQNQLIFQEHDISKDPMRVNIVESDNDDIDSDHRNQSIECDLWSPTSEDMMSLVSPRSEEENEPVTTNNGYAELKDEQPFDDLRRTVGSFDEREEEEEREGPPPLEEREPNQESFPATFARRVVGQRPRKSRFWKKRFLALKNRGRQVTAE